MAKPNSQKEVGAEGAEKQSGGKGNGIIVNIITSTLICSIFLVLTYVMINDAIKNQKNNLTSDSKEIIAAAYLTTDYNQLIHRNLQIYHYHMNHQFLYNSQL